MLPLSGEHQLAEPAPLLCSWAVFNSLLFISVAATNISSHIPLGLAPGGGISGIKVHGQLCPLLHFYASVSSQQLSPFYPTVLWEADLGGQVADKALEPERPRFKSTFFFLLCDIEQIT